MAAILQPILVTVNGMLSRRQAPVPTGAIHDRGKDLIAVKRGFMALRVVESVKRYTPGHVVTAEEVDALIGVISKQPQTNKGIISTTWEFAPKIMDDPDIARLVPTRLQLLKGAELVKRLVEFTHLKSK
jgi:restriction system protein